jgi:hypothetical protein
MRTILIIIFIITAFFSISCGQNLRLEKSTSISVIVSKNSDLNKGFQYIEKRNSESFTCIDSASKKIYYYNIVDSKIIDSISLTGILKKYTYSNLQYFTLTNSGSAFFLIEGINTIVQIGSDGEIIMETRYSGEDKDTGSFTLVARPSCPLLCSKDIICAYNYTSDNISTPEGQKMAFSNNSDVMFILPAQDNNKVKISSKTGRFPLKYKTTFYYDMYPARCINQNNEIVYSFAADKNIYIFDQNGLKDSIDASSKFHEDTGPFPMDSMWDFNYIRKYFITEPKYVKIIFDPYRNLYYRVFQKRGKYLNEDGSFNTSIDWTLLVFDSSFNKLSEIVFDGAKYSAMSLFPAKEGLLVGLKQQGKEANGALANKRTLNFELYKIIK